MAFEWFRMAFELRRLRISELETRCSERFERESDARESYKKLCLAQLTWKASTEGSWKHLPDWMTSPMWHLALNTSLHGVC